MMKKKIIVKSIISTLIVFAALLIFLIIFRIFPFGDRTIITYDLYQQVYPFMVVLHDKLKSGEGLEYFWNGGLGGNYLVTYFFYLASPSNLLVYFIDKGDIQSFITFSILIKISLCAGTFCFFLSNKTEDSVIDIPFSIAYALGNYILAYYHESMWLDSFVLFPIIMWGYERLIRDKKPVVYIVSLALCAYCNFYIIYLIALFLCLWFILDDYRSFKEFIIKGLWFGLSSLLAAGMTAVSIVVSYLGVNTTHVSNEELVSHEWYGNIFEVLRYQFAFSKLQPLGDKLNQANIYCGTLSVLLMFMFLFNGDIKISRRIKRLILLLFMIISMDETVLNFVWHSFHVPIQIPNRFGFLFVFVVLFTAKESLDVLNKENTKMLAIGVVLAGLYPIVCYYFVDFDTDIGSKNVLLISIVLIFVYGIILFVSTQGKRVHKYLLFILSGVMLVELLANAFFGYFNAINHDDFVVEDMKMFEEVLGEDVKKQDGKFKRSSIIYDEYKNFDSLFGVNGLDIFSSIFSYDTHKFCYFNGVYTVNNGVKGYGYSEILENILDMEDVYVLKKMDCFSYKKNYSLAYSTENVNVYKNKDALSLGFGVNKDVLNYTNYKGNTFYNMNEMMTQMSGVSDVYEELIPDYSIDASGGTLALENSDHLYLLNQITDYKNRNVDIDFIIPQDGEYYIAPSIEKENHMIIYKNDVIFRKLSISSFGVMIYIGECNSGDNIRVELSNASDEKYRNISQETIELRVARLNESVYNQMFENLSYHQMLIHEMKSNHIKAEISIEDNQLLFTSIPYDKGWKAYENGKEIQIIKLADAFIGVDLGEGKHEIELRYSPPGIRMGLLITIISWLIFGIAMKLIYYRRDDT